METIKCTIWKLGSSLYRITVDDMRYRSLDTGCISDIDTLFESMEEIEETIKKEQNVIVSFKTLNKEKYAMKR